MQKSTTATMTAVWNNWNNSATSLMSTMTAKWKPTATKSLTFSLGTTTAKWDTTLANSTTSITTATSTTTSSKTHATGTAAPATTHVVQVGGVDGAGNPVLKFNPPFISATPGDFVQFNFSPANHSATVSSFEEPCAHNGTDFDSGFMPTNANAPIVPVTGFSVQDQNPIWMYCRQKGKGPKTHCQSGMVFAVNPKPSGNTFNAFLANAINSTIQNQDASTIPTGTSASKDTSNIGVIGNSAASSTNLIPIFALLGLLVLLGFIAIGVGLAILRSVRTGDTGKSSKEYKPIRFPPPKPVEREYYPEMEYQGATGRYTDGDQ